MTAAELRGASRPSLDEALGWVGSRVDDIYGTGVGRLEDVWIDPGTGMPRWLLVKEGRFGGRTTLIPFEDATAGAGHVWIPYERDIVREAPAVQPGAPLTKHLEAQLREHYASATADSHEHQGRQGQRQPAPVAAAAATREPRKDERLGSALGYASQAAEVNENLHRSGSQYQRQTAESEQHQFAETDRSNDAAEQQRRPEQAWPAAHGAISSQPPASFGSQHREMQPSPDRQGYEQQSPTYPPPAPMYPPHRAPAAAAYGQAPPQTQQPEQRGEQQWAPQPTWRPPSYPPPQLQPAPVRAPEAEQPGSTLPPPMQLREMAPSPSPVPAPEQPDHRPEEAPEDPEPQRQKAQPSAEADGDHAAVPVIHALDQPQRVEIELTGTIKISGDLTGFSLNPAEQDSE